MLIGKDIPMSKNKIFIISAIFILLVAGVFVFAQKENNKNALFVSYIVDPKKKDIRLYWKNDKQENFKSMLNVKDWLEKQKKNLIFAMNAGMYKPDNSPQGLFIEKQELKSPLDTSSGNGNFYLKPNGIFYITVNNMPAVCVTDKFIYNNKIKYATQSGPMLVIDGKIHPALKKGSNNLNIRNGVGVLPGNKILFAMSKKEINFYDFAEYFKSMGCKNALYLDGLVSRTYLPAQHWEQTDGNFGVIIGIIENQK